MDRLSYKRNPRGIEKEGIEKESERNLKGTKRNLKGAWKESEKESKMYLKGTEKESNGKGTLNESKRTKKES